MRAVMMCDIGRWRARTHPSRAGRGPALAAWSAHGAGHANRFQRRAPKTNNLSDRTTVAVCGTEPPGRNSEHGSRIVTLKRGTLVSPPLSSVVARAAPPSLVFRRDCLGPDPASVRARHFRPSPGPAGRGAGPRDEPPARPPASPTPSPQPHSPHWQPGQRRLGLGPGRQRPRLGDPSPPCQ